MRTPDEFDATRQLAEQQLRDLVKDSDPLRRLHAIWALGLQMSSVVGYLAGEPDPGVRRGLAVVLAGRGELDLLVALCRHDPNVHVRASTIQIVLRFAKAGRIPWSIVVERFADAAEVRAGLVSQIDMSAPAGVRELALRALVDPEEIVRREAFEVGVAGVANAVQLRAALEVMSRGECSNALATWFAAETPDTIAAALVDTSQQVREVAIRLRPELAFTDLLPLIENDLVLYEKVSVKLGKPPLKLLLAMLDARPWRYDVIVTILWRINCGDFSKADVAPHVSKFRAVCSERLDALENQVTAPDVDEWDAEELNEERRDLSKIIGALDEIRQ